MDVEAYVLQSDDVTLCGLHREAGLYQQYGILACSLHGMVYGSEGSEGALHGACCRYASQRVYLYAYEGLDEL